MRVEVQYGDGRESADIPDENLGEIINPQDLPPLDESAVLDAALKYPLGSQTLDEFVSTAKDIIVLVNPTTTPRINIARRR